MLQTQDGGLANQYFLNVMQIVLVPLLLLSLCVLLQRSDLEVASGAIISDPPGIRETFLAEFMIPNQGRANLSGGQ